MNSYQKNSAVKIGLLGGSFNPLHRGHLQIAKTAIKRAGLTQVWLLVAKKNPLKAQPNLPSLEERILDITKFLQEDKIIFPLAMPQIIPSDFEKKCPNYISYPTLKLLKQCYKTRYSFAFICGADTLQSIDKWQHWRNILEVMPIICINRNRAAVRINQLKFAKYFSQRKAEPRNIFAKKIFSQPQKNIYHNWCFIDDGNIDISSTQIRLQRANNR